MLFRKLELDLSSYICIATIREMLSARLNAEYNQQLTRDMSVHPNEAVVQA